MSNLKKWVVCRVERKDITDFIEKNHYSKSINGCISDFCYALYDEHGVIKGAMFYGRMAMANQWKRFADNPADVIELRRLCCIDNTPKNTESYFIGKSLRLLKHDWGGKVVVSYADQEYGHTGVIYKASNFDYLGFQKGSKVIVFNGRNYHDKSVRTKYKGELKPFAKILVDALATGVAYYKQTQGKHTCVYKL